ARRRMETKCIRCARVRTYSIGNREHVRLMRQSCIGVLHLPKNETSNQAFLLLYILTAFIIRVRLHLSLDFSFDLGSPRKENYHSRRNSIQWLRSSRL